MGFREWWLGKGKEPVGKKQRNYTHSTHVANEMVVLLLLLLRVAGVRLRCREVPPTFYSWAQYREAQQQPFLGQNESIFFARPCVGSVAAQ